MPKTTILFVFNRALSAREISRVRSIAKSNDAELVYIGKDSRITHHTGWITYPDIGRQFTTPAASRIRAEIEAAGIALD